MAITISLFSFSKRENSTKRPTGGVSIECYLKENTSLYNPSFTILKDNMSSYNYLKWESRYYYITDCVSIGNAQWQVDCKIDVLATWKTEIGSTSAYKLYATLGYDIEIPDTRLSTESEGKRVYKSKPIYDPTPRYLITYSTTKPTVGGTGLVCVIESQAKAIANQISSDDFLKSLIELEKSFQSCYDSVISCIQLPFDVSSGRKFPVWLGNYDTKLLGNIPLTFFQRNAEIEIPWQFNDFRNRNPYTSFLLFLPGHGTIELNPDDLVGKRTINISLGICGLDGSAAYLVDNITKVNVNFGIFTPMNGTAYNPIGLLGGLASSAANLAAGNVTGAALSAFHGILSTNSRITGSGGASNSGGVSPIGPAGFGQGVCVLTSICHNTTVEPSALATIQGRPVNKTAQITAGYNQCVNASVDCNAPEFLKQEINNYLNGGMYFE